MHFFDIDWRTLFGLSLPLAEIVVRGSVFYWFLFFLFRFIVRRDVGSVGIADILIIVIVADASQNALAGEYRSITDGMVLVGTLIFWNVALDWLSFRFPAIRRFAEPPPLVLIKDGRLNYRNMRRELITESELWSLLREKEVESIEQVKRAFLEADGQISVIKN
ncbi:MAG: DUF421 domain-containing protein [Burkholderiales bacterium]|nr:DUF421 domain-containing protein [Burkholderiales bacterium]